MTCRKTKRLSTDYLDGRLGDRERTRMETHLRSCHGCRLEVEQTWSVRSSLVKLPNPASPSSLRNKLLIMASRERQTLLETGGSRWMRVWNNWRFRFNQMMRPLTIPATGGVMSSVLLFGALSLTISTTTRQVAYEVPVIYGNRMDANLVPLQLRSSVVLTLSLDGRGRIKDYHFQDGSSNFVGDATRLQYNNITMPQFPSVLAMAQPTMGDISILFRPIVFRQ